MWRTWVDKLVKEWVPLAEDLEITMAPEFGIAETPGGVLKILKREDVTSLENMRKCVSSNITQSNDPGTIYCREIDIKGRRIAPCRLVTNISYYVQQNWCVRQLIFVVVLVVVLICPMYLCHFMLFIITCSLCLVFGASGQELDEPGVRPQTVYFELS